MQRDIVKEHKEEGCDDYFLSGCCGAGEHEHVENFCGDCGEFTIFECSVCELPRAGYTNDF
jgi:hypothetical protein